MYSVSLEVSKYFSFKSTSQCTVSTDDKSSIYPLIKSSKVTKKECVYVSLQVTKHKMENNFKGEMLLTQDVNK